jgi:hypothetical protein
MRQHSSKDINGLLRNDEGVSKVSHSREVLNFARPNLKVMAHFEIWIEPCHMVTFLTII